MLVGGDRRQLDFVENFTLIASCRNRIGSRRLQPNCGNSDQSDANRTRVWLHGSRLPLTTPYRADAMQPDSTDVTTNADNVGSLFCFFRDTIVLDPSRACRLGSFGVASR